ncbi:xanthine dehydrogenase family protein molybdopterin-binding subunit [Nonomuraea sp. NPDC046802]|uniref:xanthine dehydrogenase family protein molybdopterin-binding subunit n=1 Tax=Nonomuraea sp. NPDC046802 TaxID=3154919 RepID=UPI0033E7F78E
MSLIGRSRPRTEDAALLTTGGRYTGDLEVPGCLHLVLVRSTLAHARLGEVRTGAAAAAEGVATVLTAADVPLPPMPPEVGTVRQDMPQPLLAGDVVRFAGEPVAAVVAESRAAAVAAARLVEVDYQVLPPLVDPRESLRDEALVHPEAGTNTALKLTFGRPPGRADIFAECEVVVRQSMVNQRVAACPLEARGGVAVWADDRLTYHAGSQAPHLWRERLAGALGLEESTLRVITGDVGGAFGSKAFPGPEDVLVCWAAMALGRPVRWQETRTENVSLGGHGRAQIQEAELGGTRDGQVSAYRLSVVQDAGAYPRIGAVLPFWTRTMLTGPYLIGKAKFTAASVVTTTPPVGSYRGAGQPEAVAALERMMDRYAAEIGMDPAEVRRRNLIPSDRFPFTTLTRATYDSGDYHEALDRVLDAADYPALRAEQRRRREAGERLQLGIGLSVFAELTGADMRQERAEVTLEPGGRFLARAGTCGHGQGHATAWATLAAEVLGADPGLIDVRQGDTDAMETGGGTGGSRSLQTGGLAVREAALALVEEAKGRAAKVLGVEQGQVAFSGAVFTGPDGGTLGWAELAESGPLTVAATYQPTSGTCSYGAHLAVVEVDVETGHVRLERVVAVDDAGVLVNPLIAEGQVHGGLAQGVAQALVEEAGFDAQGRPLHADLSAYAFISAAELPSFETVAMQTPAPGNPLGVKGIGESGAVGVPPAVQNAVVDALAHLGVTHVDMPATPQRVWRAIQDAVSTR